MVEQNVAWQLTINNPAEHDLTHDKLKLILEKWKAVKYWCMCDEIGLHDKTYHTHLYIHTCSTSKIAFKTIKNKIPEAHIEPCIKGSPQQNRDYIRKEGNYKGTAKEETNLKDTFEEFGELPPESAQGKRTDLNTIYDMIREGKSTFEILEENPNSMRYLDKIERTRYVLRQEEFKNKFRNMHVTYIYGKAGSGKTRSVMDKYGYENVYRVTDYKHPFDAYNGQSVVIFEEFRSSFRIGDVLNFLDGYPLDLPCRYNNKIACFETVFIISNIPFRDQYTDIQKEYPETWAAFQRRIHGVIRFAEENGEIIKVRKTVYEELHGFLELSDAEQKKLDELFGVI